MTPTFVDPAARLCWDSYFAQVDRLLARAGVEVRGLRDDLALHVIDSMAAVPVGGELGTLQAALRRLGQPVDYLRPLLADDLLERGTRTYSPVTIAWGLFHAVRAGSRRAVIALVFALGYLLVAIFAAMAALKPMWGEHIGLFRYPDGRISGGIVATQTGAQELLGWWSIPVALVLAALLFVALTRGLRALRPSH